MGAPPRAPSRRALNLLSAGAAQGLVEALHARFEAEAQAVLGVRFGAIGALREALAGGAPCDVLIVSDTMLRELAAAGAIRDASRRPIGAVRTGVAVRAGEPVPRLDGAAALRAALLAATALHVPDLARSTAGAHVASVLERLGVRDALELKLSLHANGAAAMQALAQHGPAGAVGLTQITEIRRTSGLVLAGALPEPFGLTTVYAAGIAAETAEPALAERLVALLSGAATAALRRDLAFEP